MRAALLASSLVLAACATTPDARAVMGPCARARLAREFLEVPAFAGCYGVVAGPRELQRAQIVMLTKIAEEVLDDEPPRYRLATLKPFVTAQSTSWEQLSATWARLLWMTGSTGVEMCLQTAVPCPEGAGDPCEVERLQGHVVVVTDYAPFLHVAGPVTLMKQPCPS